EGCERVIFGSPQNVAAAVAYVSARVALLVEGLDAAERTSNDGYESALSSLRRGFEADHFGIVAHVLSQQAGCEPENCEALALLPDPNKVRVNLQDKTFDAIVGRHVAAWSQNDA